MPRELRGGLRARRGKRLRARLIPGLQASLLAREGSAEIAVRPRDTGLERILRTERYDSGRWFGPRSSAVARRADRERGGQLGSPVFHRQWEDIPVHRGGRCTRPRPAEGYPAHEGV